jgi:hypothetical protein
MYQFLVGPEKRVFRIHPEVLHPHTVLSSFANEQSKESVEQTVVWEDVNPEGFHSLCQFLYTGTYDYPPKAGNKRKREGAETLAGPSEAALDDLEPPRKRPCTSAEWSPNGVFLSPFSGSEASGLPSERSVATSDPTSIIMHHVNVRLLAGQYGLEDLVNVAQSKMGAFMGVVAL